MAGRRLVPGERGTRGVLNPTGVHNRTIRAQVSAVDADNGYVIFTYESLPSGGKYATVPPLWLSFPPASVGGPAWGRFMPQITDMVKVSFDYNDEPRIVGYDVVANKPLVGDGHSGWPQLKDINENAKNSSDTSKAKFGQFNPLKPGEYDFMSSGGAYIYGGSTGRLYLAGGAVSISLVKNDMRMQARALLWSHIADDSEFKFGQVRRRKDDGTEAIVSSDQNGDFKEFRVTVNKSTDSGKQELASIVVGNVVDDTGNIVQGKQSSIDARYLLQVYNDSAQLKLQQFFDKEGNIEIHAPDAGVGVYVDFTNSDWKSKFKNVSWDVSGKYYINSNDVHLGASTANNPLILTNTYGPAEQQVITALANQINALSTAVVTSLTAMSTWAAAFAATPAVPATLGVLATLAGAIAPTIAGVTAPGAQAVADASVFTTGYNERYFSKKVRTE